MGGMGMGGMGGMGMGMGGMSPWMGGNMGSMSPAGEVASPNNVSSAGYSGNGIRTTQSQERADSVNQSNRGRNLQAPTSAGLPSRPNAQANQSPNPSSGGGGGGGGRDYNREKSPERGSKGGYNRDNRW